MGGSSDPFLILPLFAYADFRQLLENRGIFHNPPRLYIYLYVLEVRSPSTVGYALWWNNLMDVS